LDESSGQGATGTTGTAVIGAPPVDALRIVRLAGETPTEALRACVSALDPAAPRDYRELAALLAFAWRGSRPRRVGLTGGQGTGKSTLAPLIVEACGRLGLRACALALDDYYLPRAERAALARRVHPLFETRGPPGTHEIERLRRDLLALAEPGAVYVPCFDKGLDERAGARCLEGPFDLVVLEGWCVGAAGEDASALALPVNDLERDEDARGTWRGHANARLATDYAAVWDLLDAIVLIEAPDLEAVRRWRLAQESALPPERRRDASEIDRFVQHFERITRALLARPPARTAWRIALAPDHSIAALRRARPEDPDRRADADRG